MSHGRVLGTLMVLPLVALVFVGGSFPVRAQEWQDTPYARSPSMFGIDNCVGALQNGGNEFTPVTDCAIDHVFSGLTDVAFQHLESSGKKQFGEHFHIDRQLSFTASSGTFSADLDFIMPLAAFSATTNDATTRAFFMQNGITRWRDERGFQRTDTRLGFVHRFELYEQPGDGLLGASIFLQENLERGHVRMVTGIEYLDRWGQFSLNHYAPLTGWRVGRNGYEERALAGTELAYRMKLTDTIDLKASGGHWQSKFDEGAWTSSGKLDFGWNPHPWLMLGGGWDGIGTGHSSSAVHASVTMPLGGANRPPPRWKGVGRRDSSAVGFDAGTIWTAAQHVNQIEVIERQKPMPEKVDDAPSSYDFGNLSAQLPLGALES